MTATAGDEFAEENKSSIADDLRFINIFLLVFAAVAVVVSTFLIVNTFSILVAQRSRELALLRAMGASRRQVNRSVLIEAFVGRVHRVDDRDRSSATCWRSGSGRCSATFGLDLSRRRLPGQATHDHHRATPSVSS